MVEKTNYFNNIVIIKNTKNHSEVKHQKSVSSAEGELKMGNRPVSGGTPHESTLQPVCASNTKKHPQ